MGTGINKIRSLLKEANLPAPKFEFTTFFTIIFTRPVSREKIITKGLVEKLSANEKIIYALIKGNPYISKSKMMSQGKITKKIVEYNIEKFKKKDIIKRVGPDRDGHWEIIK